MPAGYFEAENANEYVAKYGIPFEVALFIVGLEEEMVSDEEKEEKRLKLIKEIKTNEVTILKETLVFRSTELAQKIIYILNEKKQN